VVDGIGGKPEEERRVPALKESKHIKLIGIRYLFTFSKIRQKLGLPFPNKRAFLKYIDSLPRGATWACTPLVITGNDIDGDGAKKKEVVELWHRDVVEVVKELLGNPAFKGKLGFRPQRLYRNPNRTNREYSEMWTANWWWNIQVSFFSLTEPIITS
jgi:hypothetical protein